MAYISVFLITASATLAALLLCLALFYRGKGFFGEGVSTRKLLIVMIGAGIVCRAVFLLLTPTFYAPDEQSHFKYVKYLAEHRSFPVQTARTDALTNDWEYYQPPLYYLSLTPFYWLSQKLIHDEAISVLVLRALSIALWGMTLFFTLRFLGSLKIDDIFVKTFVVGMVSLLPTYTSMSSVINNDNLLIAIGSAILWLAVRPTSFRNSALVGILLGLALLTKLTAVVYFPLIACIVFMRWAKKTISGSVVVPHIALPVMIAALMWAPWGFRNWIVYGSITAEEVANVAHQWNSVFQAIRVSLRYMERSFWATSGIHNNLGSVYPLAGRCVFAIAAAGFLVGVFVKREKLILFTRNNADAIIASLLAVIINATLVLRFGVLYAQAQGRFLFPLLIPVSLLLAIGFRMFSLCDRESSRLWVAAFFVTYAVSFAFYSVGMFAILTP